jgi:hypothetical protein
MPSKFHLQNGKIRKALARRAREKGLADDCEEEARQNKSSIRPDEPGDGHIVRKHIYDEGDEYDV